MPSADEALFWLPTAAVAVVALLAVVIALAQPPRPARLVWLALALLLGAAAIAATAWYQLENRSEGPAQLAQLRDIGGRIDELGRDLPAGAGQAPADNFDSFGAAADTLNGKVAALGGRILALREEKKNREIDPQTAGKLSEYLRQFGSARIVVSCLPNDVEAFGYANQIANILRAAGWDAHGPEETTIFGNAQAMGVVLYVRPGTQAPPAAKILLDAFARFNIPYKAGISPNEAIPDPATVELFIGHKA
ncbi:MAG TPA: hypothetical protein VF007_11260 [Stellaceae bacterium]